LKSNLWAILVLGLIIRLAIAPITGHAYDLALWANYQRIFFGSGISDLRYFPTLPMLYYFQLASYSFYALMRSLGLQDPLFFYHPTYAVEAVFLKLPMILADMGVFLLFARSGKLVPALLYYLNPFIIYLSSAWGTYDSLMMVFLVAGFTALERDNKRLATIAFTVSGLLKLFGFIPLGLLMLNSLGRRQFKSLLVQMTIVSSLVLTTLAPAILQIGSGTFYSEFSRFVGISTAQGRSWSAISALTSSSSLPLVPEAAAPMIWIAYGSVPVAFAFLAWKKHSLFLSVLQATLLGAVLLNIFSQAEPQWLSWPIPLALIFASATGRNGLRYFAYAFGAIATFLVMTLTGTGYLLFGLLGTSYLAPLEGFAGEIRVYAITTLSLLLLLLGYSIAKPVKFKLEALILVVIIFAQAYFWFSIVGIQSL